MIQSPKQLMNYLSSGTIKGISVFINAMITFQEGGYLLIDELENHFNHEIVATLVRFFTQRSVNANGGTLVFTTHYPELLDIIDRAESIYLVRNYGEITAKRLNYDLSRNDLKKSEIYISDFLGGTAPSYETYMALKKAMMPPKAAVKNYG